MQDGNAETEADDQPDPICYCGPEDGYCYCGPEDGKDTFLVDPYFVRKPALLDCCNRLVDQYPLTVLNNTKMGETEMTH